MLKVVVFSITAVTCKFIFHQFWKSHESLTDLWNVPDKRTDPWLLVYSPVPVSVIFLLYLCVVWVGPGLMKHRQPVDLRVVLIVYNFVMVGLSAYMFYEVCLCYVLLKQNQPGTHGGNTWISLLVLNTSIFGLFSQKCCFLFRISVLWYKRSCWCCIYVISHVFNSSWSHPGSQTTAYSASLWTTAPVRSQWGWVSDPRPSVIWMCLCNFNEI